MSQEHNLNLHHQSAGNPSTTSGVNERTGSPPNALHYAEVNNQLPPLVTAAGGSSGGNTNTPVSRVPTLHQSVYHQQIQYFPYPNVQMQQNHHQPLTMLPNGMTMQPHFQGAPPSNPSNRVAPQPQGQPAAAATIPEQPATSTTTQDSSNTVSESNPPRMSYTRERLENATVEELNRICIERNLPRKLDLDRRESLIARILFRCGNKTQMKQFLHEKITAADAILTELNITGTNQSGFLLETVQRKFGSLSCIVSQLRRSSVISAQGNITRRDSVLSSTGQQQVMASNSPGSVSSCPGQQQPLIRNRLQSRLSQSSQPSASVPNPLGHSQYPNVPQQQPIPNHQLMQLSAQYGNNFQLQGAQIHQQQGAQIHQQQGAQIHQQQGAQIHQQQGAQIHQQQGASLQSQQQTANRNQQDGSKQLQQTSGDSVQSMRTESGHQQQRRDSVQHQEPVQQRDATRQQQGATQFPMQHHQSHQQAIQQLNASYSLQQLQYIQAHNMQHNMPQQHLQPQHHPTAHLLPTQFQQSYGPSNERRNSTQYHQLFLNPNAPPPPPLPTGTSIPQTMARNNSVPGIQAEQATTSGTQCLSDDSVTTKRKSITALPSNPNNRKNKVGRSSSETPNGSAKREQSKKSRRKSTLCTEVPANITVTSTVACNSEVQPQTPHSVTAALSANGGVSPNNIPSDITCSSGNKQSAHSSSWSAVARK